RLRKRAPHRREEVRKLEHQERDERDDGEIAQPGEPALGKARQGERRERGGREEKRREFRRPRETPRERRQGKADAARLAEVPPIEVPAERHEERHADIEGGERGVRENLRSEEAERERAESGRAAVE